MRTEAGGDHVGTHWLTGGLITLVQILSLANGRWEVGMGWGEKESDRTERKRESCKDR